MMMKRIGAVAVAALTMLAQPGFAQDAPADLAARLQEGGLVVFFRHGVTRPDEESVPRIEGCEDERNLTDAGRSALQGVHAAFQAIDPEISEVLSSPFCRARETAIIAFGDVQVTDALSSRIDDARDAERLVETSRLLSTPPAPGTLRIMVAHYSNLTDALGISIAEGEAAIFDPQDDGEGEPELIGPA